MKPFLDKIAARLLKKFPTSMEGIAVVLPSKRAIVFLKHYLSQRIDKPIFLPQFYSIEEFTEKLSGFSVLDNISLQFKLYQTYLKHPPIKTDTFDNFLKWSNVLLHDFNDLDRNLVDVESIYTNLTNVKELESWSVEDWSLLEDDLTRMQTDYISFFEGMFTWYADFRSTLFEESLAYPGMADRQAAEQIESTNIQWNRIWFVGLNALTKSEQAIIDYLKKEDIARVFWDADNFYYDNPMHEAGGFLREQREKWSEIDFKGVGDYFATEKQSFKVVACPKNIAQAKVVAEVISSFSAKDLDNSNTAIVLADEGLLFPVLHNLPSQVKQLNVTMGSPLKHSAVFSFVEALFFMQIHVNNYSQDTFYYKDVIAVVEHPYFTRLSVEQELMAFKRFIIKNNIIFVSKHSVVTYFKQTEIANIIFSSWKNVKDAILFLNTLIEKLRLPLIGKQGSIESEVLATFYKSITVLETLICENNFDLELKSLQVIIQQLVAKETIPFKGEPLKGVQLMGILESRTLDFKNVIILSVNEGKLPKGKVVNSFIPYDMKRYFKLPTYAESDAVFSYHFYRLLQRANDITLIYNSETDDFGGGERSRFITQLLSEYQGKIQELVYQGKELEIPSNSQIVIQNKGLEEEIKAWAEKGVSPSALNKYNTCSLQFYYHYLLKIREDEQVDEYADASTIGTVIHDALERVYPLDLLTPQFIKNNTKVILQQIKDGFIAALSEQAIQEGKNYLSLKVAQKITQDFLRLEVQLLQKALEENKQIKIIGKEEELAYSLRFNGLDFNLIGKVDRLDFEGDTLRIIDYKTGKVEDSEVMFSEYDEIIDNPNKTKAFQLLMYAYLYLKINPQYIDIDVVAGIFSFKNLKSGLITVSKKTSGKQKQVIKIDMNTMENFQQQLEAVLTRISNDDFVQTSDIKVCEWCDYKSICRK